jgi:GNAT superfamily N-acetyltransferase
MACVKAAFEATLRNPVWCTLIGRNAHLAERSGRVARFRDGTSPLVGMAQPPAPGDFAALASLVGPGKHVALAVPASPTLAPPSAWPPPQFDVACAQLFRPRAAGPLPDNGPACPYAAVPLEAGDSPAAVAFAAETKPGPFTLRAPDFGHYVCIKDEKGLILAMAGERMRPPGTMEVSAVCTRPGHTGRGYARVLIAAVVQRIYGTYCEDAMLHCRDRAVALYLSLSFSRVEGHDDLRYIGARTPDQEAPQEAPWSRGYMFCVP